MWRWGLESWRRAAAMTATAAAGLASGIGEHDALDGVGDVVQAVQGLLQPLDDVLPDQHIAGRVLAGERVQLGPGAPVDTVALLLRLGHRHLIGPQPPLVELAQVAQPAGGLLGSLEDDPGCSRTGSMGSATLCRTSMSAASSTASATGGGWGAGG